MMQRFWYGLNPLNFVILLNKKHPVERSQKLTLRNPPMQLF